MKLLDRDAIHSHTYRDKAVSGDRCSLCKRQFAVGETIRDHRSTINIDGFLFCWNGERCAKNIYRENKKEN